MKKMYFAIKKEDGVKEKLIINRELVNTFRYIIMGSAIISDNNIRLATSYVYEEENIIKTLKRLISAGEVYMEKGSFIDPIITAIPKKYKYSYQRLCGEIIDLVANSEIW